MEMLEAYEKALDNSGRIVRGIRPHHLGRPTPCAGWLAGDLIGHLIGVTLVYGAGGLQADEKLQPAEIGSDPGWAYALAAKTSLDTFAAAGAMDAMFRLPVGEVPGSAALALAVAEAAVHGWDLAVATGKSPTIDAGVAELVLAEIRPILTPDVRRGPQPMFGPEVPVATEAHASDRLVGFLGRNPVTRG
jgi:uncharacterized protein (TIGR03086 family)